MLQCRIALHCSQVPKYFRVQIFLEKTPGAVKIAQVKCFDNIVFLVVKLRKTVK